MKKEFERVQSGGRTLVIRFCEGLEEMAACAALQVEIWGYEDGEALPRRSFLLSMKIGGQVIGAFDVTGEAPDACGNSSNLVGFAMSLPGIKEQARPYLHSHMLAVHAEYRNYGVGRRLKLAQRNDALARGITLMEWTFDPLEIKNAFLNIVRLGAIVRSYTPNFYGVSSSRLHGGLPTDRLHAEWWMQTDRVVAAFAGQSTNPSDIQETILVPSAISQWKASPQERPRALEAQSEIRNRFQAAFARGLAVTAFSKQDDGSGLYQLGRWQQP